MHGNVHRRDRGGGANSNRRARARGGCKAGCIVAWCDGHLMERVSYACITQIRRRLTAPDQASSPVSSSRESMTSVPEARLTFQVMERPSWSPRSALRAQSRRELGKIQCRWEDEQGVTARVCGTDDKEVIRTSGLRPSDLRILALYMQTDTRQCSNSQHRTRCHRASTTALNTNLDEGGGIDREVSTSAAEGDGRKESGSKECGEHCER